ncbi:MAG: type II toxin-antitoxin system RelE/ParE family toxin [Candidatus Omnitrophica bacterium]|nr:type II toxin-antitoxin system RelE/ParE family toxin [Candidatus Omnitrophota bacterium]MDE2223161.1 type II toxin-antitoxin system RelE/ParE family toxin [Candidatus Omnitrophota bacterium]
MEFIETPDFIKLASLLLGAEGVRLLQTALILHPSAGALIPGTGGLRKLRWASSSKGKRGGLRVIYYWITNDHKIVLLYVYKKSSQDDLSTDELKRLKSFIEED